MGDKWVIVGGGINGIIAAYTLSAHGQKALLIEPEQHIGGVLRSVPWKGFFLDKGCHLFSNEKNEVTDIILDILGDSYEPFTVRYASIYEKELTHGFAIPNLEKLPENAKAKIFTELYFSDFEAPFSCENLFEQYRKRFGPTAAKIFESLTQKIFCCSAKSLGSEAINHTPFKRIKFLDDSRGEYAKQDARIADLLAVSSQSNPLRFYQNESKKVGFRHFYPKGKGMATFCELAHKKLVELGVDIKCGIKVNAIEPHGVGARLKLSDQTQLETPKVYWAAGLEGLAKSLKLDVNSEEYIHRVPAIYHYFAIDEADSPDLTYAQNYDGDSTWYRMSCPGNYINASACPPGKSYVCCEVPTKQNSELWNMGKEGAPQVWRSLFELGIVKNKTYLDSVTVKVPRTYAVPKRDFKHLAQKVEVEIGRLSENIIWNKDALFSKNEIIEEVLKNLS